LGAITLKRGNHVKNGMRCDGFFEEWFVSST